MRFVWDTVDDAKEFAFTVLEFVEQKSQGLWDLVEAEETEDRSTGLWVGDGISVYLSHEAAGSTLIVVGPDRESVGAAVTEAGARDRAWRRGFQGWGWSSEPLGKLHRHRLGLQVHLQDNVVYRRYQQVLAFLLDDVHVVALGGKDVVYPAQVSSL